MSETIENAVIECDLVGVDGNAYALMGHWKRAARWQEVPEPDIKKVLSLAMSGDYNNLLCVLQRHCL